MSELNVKEIRNDLGKSQSELASMLGVTLRTIQNWEAGKVIPKSKYEILRTLSDTKSHSNTNIGGDTNSTNSKNESINQNSNGDNNTQIAGNSNHIENSSALDRAFDEIAEMRKLLAEAIRNNKEQSDKFFSIIEKLQNK